MEDIENYFYNKNNETYQKTVTIFENILENTNDDLNDFEYFNGVRKNYNDNDINKFLLDLLDDKCNYVYNIIEEEIKHVEHTIMRHSDICMGIIMDNDCYINITFGGSVLYEKIFCKKDEIVYFDNPLLLLSCQYNLFKIIITDNQNVENKKIKFIHLYLENESRRFIAQNNICLENTIYSKNYCSNISEKILLNNDEKIHDFRFFNPNSNKYNKKKRIIERTEKYKFELIKKCWNPKRLQDWCLSLDELELIQ